MYVHHKGSHEHIHFKLKQGYTYKDRYHLELLGISHYYSMKSQNDPYISASAE